jgi:hypothetical protein
MSRKTIKIDNLRIQINKMLKDSICESGTRQGMIDVLTEVLHSTDNYKGFRYLQEHEVPSGQQPGIWWLNNEPDFTDTDPTRVCYS